MTNNKVPTKALQDLSHNPTGVILDFNKIATISFRSKNIADSTLLGNIADEHHFNKINIIHSTWKGVKAKDVNFYNVDIKDCSVKKSLFDGCNFNEAAHINNDIADTQFYQCTFNQTAITDSEFYNTTFTKCNFSNVVISASRFNKCKFIKCITSNKFIESSLLFNCRFEETNIQPETVIENFGISKKNLIKSNFRYGNKKKSAQFVTAEKLSGDLINAKLSAIDIFLISYFHNPGTLSEGSDEIDSTFDYMNWIKISKNSNRFRLLIERYHDFILFNYDQGKAPFWLILKLHKMTDELAKNVDPNKIDIYRSIMGIHMSLSRLVEEFLQLCENLFLKCMGEGEINFLVEGPIDESYYYKNLNEIFDDRTLTIKKIVKHNSPNELLVVWEKVKDLMPIITVFLATRVKFGIQKLVSSTSANANSVINANTQINLSPKSGAPNAYDIIRTEFGFDKNVNNYLFKLRAILPGNLLVQLHIELRTKIFGKIKKIILDILPHSTVKP